MVGQGLKVPVVVMMAVLLKLNILGSIFSGKIVFEKMSLEPQNSRRSFL